MKDKDVFFFPVAEPTCMLPHKTYSNVTFFTVFIIPEKLKFLECQTYA